MCEITHQQNQKLICSGVSPNQLFLSSESMSTSVLVLINNEYKYRVFIDLEFKHYKMTLKTHLNV